MKTILMATVYSLPPTHILCGFIERNPLNKTHSQARANQGKVKASETCPFKWKWGRLPCGRPRALSRPRAFCKAAVSFEVLTELLAPTQDLAVATAAAKSWPLLEQWFSTHGP